MITANKARGLKTAYENKIRESEEYKEAMRNIETIITERASIGNDFASVTDTDPDMRYLILAELKDAGFTASMSGKYLMIAW